MWGDFFLLFHAGFIPNCSMPTAAPLLTLDKVSKEYVLSDGAPPLKVLEGVSLEVSSGEALAIIGPSGSGKSTLLHIMGTLDRPTSGTVSLNGRDLISLSDTELAAVRNQAIGFVFQFHYLLPQCNVLENVLVPTLARTAPLAGSESPEARASRLLKRVGLSERSMHRPGQLSGGERQRVAVVRALINQPQLLLADEPTGSLDHASAQQLGQLLIDLNREEKVTLIVATHARELAQRMERVLEVKDGRLVPEAVVA
jgi:lipoprotein-releasing system ATP-binding protein